MAQPSSIMYQMTLWFYFIGAHRLLLVLAITLGVAAGITLLILVACFICPGCLLHKKRRPGTVLHVSSHMIVVTRCFDLPPGGLLIDRFLVPRRKSLAPSTRVGPVYNDWWWSCAHPPCASTWKGNVILPISTNEKRWSGAWLISSLPFVRPIVTVVRFLMRTEEQIGLPLALLRHKIEQAPCFVSLFSFCVCVSLSLSLSHDYLPLGSSVFISVCGHPLSPVRARNRSTLSFPSWWMWQYSPLAYLCLFDIHFLLLLSLTHEDFLYLTAYYRSSVSIALFFHDEHLCSCNNEQPSSSSSSSSAGCRQCCWSHCCCWSQRRAQHIS